MEADFALVLWPYSQMFVGREDCFFYTGNTDGEFDENLSQAIFVPTEIMAETESAEAINGIAGQYNMHENWEYQENGLTGNSYEEDNEEEFIFVEVEQ